MDHITSHTNNKKLKKDVLFITHAWSVHTNTDKCVQACQHQHTCKHTNTTARLVLRAEHDIFTCFFYGQCFAFTGKRAKDKNNIK